MAPRVLFLIPCDEVQVDPHNLHRFDIKGLMIQIRSRQTPPFPVHRPLFRVLVVARGCSGDAEFFLRIVREETDKVIFQSETRPAHIVGPPEQALAWKFNVADCVFPAAGVYWIEFIWAGTTIGRHPLRLLSSEDE
jgi:hypothetical protein